MNDTLTSLIGFLEKSPTAFHAVRQIRSCLDQRGYEERKEDQRWTLEPGKGYYVCRNDSAVIAFRIPEGVKDAPGFRLFASHSDSPMFKIKPGAGLASEDLVLLNVERYGGAVLSGWFDRPLSIAGRIFVSDHGRIERIFLDFEECTAVIPSVAPHLTRDKGNVPELNIQRDFKPILCQGDDTDGFWTLIEKKTGYGRQAILGHDLFLVNHQQPIVWGPQGEFLSGPRLDDLECCFGSFLGFLAAEDTGRPDLIPLHCVFDNEEVGSRSLQGADSTFLDDTLRRICLSLGMGEEEYHIALAKSLLISADNGHAAHPNMPETSDPVNRPRMNQGIVLKYQGELKYTTDGRSAAIVTEICRKKGIPLQTYANRSDITGGSTLGNLLETHLPISSADIGLAQLAMHSCFETAGSRDVESLVSFAQAFYTYASDYPR